MTAGDSSFNMGYSFTSDDYSRRRYAVLMEELNAANEILLTTPRVGRKVIAGW